MRAAGLAAVLSVALAGGGDNDKGVSNEKGPKAKAARGGGRRKDQAKKKNLIDVEQLAAKAKGDAAAVVNDKDDLFFEEDEKYWGRFLKSSFSVPSQMPSVPPSPAPTTLCNVEVDITCVSTDGVECMDIPTTTPENPEDCIETVVYTYEITNPTDAPQTIEQLLRTKEDGTTQNITSLLPKTVLEPGETIEVTDMGMEINICEGTTFSNTVQVIMEVPPEAPVCTDTATYEFTPQVPCDVEVEILCTTTIDGDEIDCDEIPAAETEQDCSVDVTYTFLVKNIGPTTETINSLTRSFSNLETSETKDLTADLDDTILDAGESTNVMETTTLNICENRTFAMTAEVNASYHGTTCEVSDEYTFAAPWTTAMASVGDIVFIKRAPSGEYLRDSEIDDGINNEVVILYDSIRGDVFKWQVEDPKWTGEESSIRDVSFKNVATGKYLKTINSGADVITGDVNGNGKAATWADWSFNDGGKVRNRKFNDKCLISEDGTTVSCDSSADVIVIEVLEV